MRRMKSMCVLAGLAFVVATVAISTDTHAQRPADAKRPGPPAWVLEAWESGNAPVVPENGPPAWVVEAWQNGERPTRPTGPPRRVAERQRRAAELGLPGPPAEVIEAWKNGEGHNLPGPPDFVLDLLGF